jgi:hypothetical protein
LSLPRLLLSVFVIGAGNSNCDAFVFLGFCEASSDACLFAFGFLSRYVWFLRILLVQLRIAGAASVGNITWPMSWRHAVSTARLPRSSSSGSSTGGAVGTWCRDQWGQLSGRRLASSRPTRLTWTRQWRQTTIGTSPSPCGHPSVQGPSTT